MEIPRIRRQPENIFRLTDGTGYFYRNQVLCLCLCQQHHDLIAARDEFCHRIR